MKVVLILVLVAITLTSAVQAATNGRKAQVRYFNSMSQFGKVKFSASAPYTLLFDKMTEGSISDYSSLDAKKWNFTTQYTSNVVAKSDEIDLDDDAYATAFTCQVGARQLKNKLIYDTSRSPGPRVALLRTVNLVQYDYPMTVVSNDSTELFVNVPYCTVSPYIQVPPGDYYFDWYIENYKRQRGNLTGRGHFEGGRVYTYFTGPTGGFTVVDGKKRSNRSVPEELSSVVDEVTPDVEVVKQQVVAKSNRKVSKHRGAVQRVQRAK